MRSDPTNPQDDRLFHLDRLSRLLDSAIAIPGTRYRIGVDAFLGLLPGVGDGLGAALSTYIVVQAARLGYPKHVLARMVGNVALETLMGAFPIIGDLFDVVWKANVRNVALLRAATPSAEVERSARGVLVLAVVGAGIALVGAAVLAIFALRLLWGALRELA